MHVDCRITEKKMKGGNIKIYKIRVCIGKKYISGEKATEE
jgi:hypothetical protein